MTKHIDLMSPHGEFVDTLRHPNVAVDRDGDVQEGYMHRKFSFA